MVVHTGGRGPGHSARTPGGAASVPVWTPADFGVDLIGWYDAQDAASITQSSGAVSQWNDKSGKGNHVVQATGANQPSYSATGFDGTRPGIVAADANRHLSKASHPDITGLSTLTYIAAVNIDAGAGTNQRLSSIFPSGSLDFNAANSAIMAFISDSTHLTAFWNNVARSTKTFTLGAKRWVISQWDGTNNTLYVDGVAGTVVAAVPVFSSGTTILRLGNGDTGGDGFIGKQGEVIIVKRALTAGERTNLATYMARWGL
jgi:hypothetical protein